MAKKKWYEQPKNIIGSIAAIIIALGVIVGSFIKFSKTVTVYAEMPLTQEKQDQRIQRIEKYVDDEVEKKELRAQLNCLKDKDSYWDEKEKECFEKKKGK